MWSRASWCAGLPPPVCSAAFLFLAIFSFVLRLQSCQRFLHSVTVLRTSATLLILST
ncbi:hypothetical protein NDU88_002559, partial [Pleurodeles waltl]